jgi:hypothetical protein
VELENLMNEAALATARRGKMTIGWEEVDGTYFGQTHGRDGEAWRYVDAITTSG